VSGLLLAMAMTIMLVGAMGPASCRQAMADDPRMNMEEVMQPGLEAWTISAGAGFQHNLPTGPRSDLIADGVEVRWERYDRPDRALGLTVGYAKLRNIPEYINTVGFVGSYRQYCSIKPRRAIYWEGAVGLVHFDALVRELATHTNFTEHVGLGVQWPRGEEGAWTLGYRFQHVSNAGRKRPNIGLNASHLQIGYTMYLR
jgi:hypothetical protein